MTPQEIFDKVSQHLIQQGQRAVQEHLGCVYRSKEGLKCAAGCLILDEHYDSSLEGNSTNCVEVQEALIKSGILSNFEPGSREMEHSVEFRLVARLQTAHDISADDWKSQIILRLKEIAVAFGLEFHYEGEAK